MKTSFPSTCIESRTFRLSAKTVGEMLDQICPNDLTDLIISISDDLTDQLNLDFDDACHTFVGFYAVGTAIAKKILSCPPQWDGTSLIEISAPSLISTTPYIALTDTVPLQEIARTKLIISAEDHCANDESLLRQVIKILISAT